MHILITNDDGITAPGLIMLAKALHEIAEVAVVAPDRNWSASGHIKSFAHPLRARPVEFANGIPAMACDGTPADCVALTTLGLLGRQFDLVVSGINEGANVGSDMTYSGTVMAAMEAVITGTPAIAVSLDVPVGAKGEPDYSVAAKFAARVVQTVNNHPAQEKILLNVNVPFLKEEEIKGIRISRQGQRVYRDELVKRKDPRGRGYYWLGGSPPTGVVEAGTDFGDLAEGYVSVRPIQLDLTNYEQIRRLKTWNW